MLELTDKNFDEKALKSKKPVVVDFWASWCGPCRAMAPIFEELAAENKAVTFAKVNVDENPGLSAKYEILGIPTVIFFKNGKKAAQQVGMAPKELLQAKIKELL